MGSREIDRAHVKIRGVAPLIHHRFAPAEQGGGIPRPEEEAIRALYKDENDVPYQPASHVKAALVKAGAQINWKKRKTYKDLIKSSVFIEPEKIKLDTPWEIYTCPVVINRARILRSRPMFAIWEVEFDIVNYHNEVMLERLQECLGIAGAMIGIGDGRPEYGRFDVIEFEKS